MHYEVVNFVYITQNPEGIEPACRRQAGRLNRVAVLLLQVTFFLHFKYHFLHLGKFLRNYQHRKTHLSITSTIKNIICITIVFNALQSTHAHQKHKILVNGTINE